MQAILGAPFLLTHPTPYFLRAFDLRRSFTYKWTVNLKFLPEEVFLSPELSVGLLLATVATLGLFAYKWIEAVRQQERRLVQLQQRSHEQKQYNGSEKQPQKQQQKQKQQNRSRSRSRNRPGENTPSPPRAGGFSSLHSMTQPLPLPLSLPNPRLSVHFILTTLFTSNLIGIAFARTLHYQFYAWYFHQLPFLLYHAAVPGWAALVTMAVVEGCYLTFPATAISSGALCIAHALLLVLLYVAPAPLAYVGLETEIRKKLDEESE